MSVSITSSGSMSPKEQFSFDKKRVFTAEKLTSGNGATVTGTGFPANSLATLTAPWNGSVLATGDVGYAILEYYHMLQTKGQPLTGGIDWTKTVTFGMRCCKLTGTAQQSDSEFRVTLGRSYATSYVNSQAPYTTINAVSFQQSGAGAIYFNSGGQGGSQGAFTSFTPVKDVAFDVVIECSGGIGKMFVNDVLVGTTTSCPITNLGIQNMALYVVCENKTAVTAGNKQAEYAISDYFLTVL